MMDILCTELIKFGGMMLQYYTSCIQVVYTYIYVYLAYEVQKNKKAQNQYKTRNHYWANIPCQSNWIPSNNRANRKRMRCKMKIKGRNNYKECTPQKRSILGWKHEFWVQIVQSIQCIVMEKILKQNNSASKQEKGLDKISVENICNVGMSNYTGRTHKVYQVDVDSVPIKIDNCCTRTLSFDVEDFDQNTLRSVQNVNIRGFGGKLSKITHSGTIQWKISDDVGHIHTITIPNSYLVPEAKTRLLSPQHWSQEAEKTNTDNHPIQCITTASSVVLLWSNGQFCKTIEIDPEKDNIATLWASTAKNNYSTFANEVIITAQLGSKNEIFDRSTSFESNIDNGSELSEEQQNEIKPNSQAISKSSYELLKWHIRCGHISMMRLQALARKGELPASIATCPIPMCSACQFGKMTKIPWRSTSHQPSIRHKDTKPGSRISVDQLISPTPGLIAQLKGAPTRLRYMAATVFIDHATDYTYVHLQQSTSSLHTLEAKNEFERHARGCGVKIEGYHADNGRFIDNAWMDDIKKQGQSMRYAAAYAHHQNGIAEKRIRDIQDLGRASLLHAIHKWPQAINHSLWPYSIRKAAIDINYIPMPNETLSPHQKFTRSSMQQNMNHIRTFGCPMYVLKTTEHPTKWESRANLAIHIGPSYQYAANVGLALNILTGLVSPVIHAKYDNMFETIQQTLPSNKTHSRWQIRCGFRPNDEDDDYTMNISEQLHNSYANPNNVMPQLLPPIPIQDIAMPTLPPPNNLPLLLHNGTIIETNEDLSSKDNTPASPPPTITRSGRASKRPKRFDNYVVFETTIANDQKDTVMDYAHPIAMTASSDPDVLYYHEILKAPDRDKFIQAMKEEIKGHNDNGNWEVVPKSSVPPTHKVLPTVWAMRRKRRLSDGTVYKWKARINVDGSKQTYGENYWETYAPVAAWATIRCVMMLASQRGWKTKQLDFVQAYPQAPAETEMYVAIPRGCKVTDNDHDYVLKLRNNIYGQKQAGKVWNDYLIAGLTNKVGFTQSKHDPSLLWRGQYLIIIYTDDTIITGPDEQGIDKIIHDIKQVFNITHADQVTDFLGVQVKKDPTTGTITMTQPLLIQSIIRDLGLNTKSNGRSFPTYSTTILGKHENSPPHNEKWNYRAIIGKLNYLEKSTRPDISYAVHQCARYMEEPKLEHSKAVKAIVRYLIQTQDKGLICQPNNTSLECYCDADFAGNYIKEEAENDVNTARSRSGYIIKYAGCPLLWKSKLQTEIALSTTESEYISLSTALREVIPLYNLLQELRKAGFDYSPNKPRLFCKAFEDNAGALELATHPKIRPRTKHINIKYHHFRQFVKDGTIEIYKISSNDQQADILTKGLPEQSFTYLRHKIMGW
jgi:Reverse transcriptase (RNA-dependent DNA polymerase)/GAG-pre-integrase domain